MKNTKKLNTFTITSIALCICINIAGSFIALTLKLPIYLDSIGTFLCTFLSGIPFGIVTGLLSNAISAILFDPVSIFFMPVQIVLVLSSGFLFKKNMLKKFKIVPSILIITLFTSTISSIIAFFVFKGITSSGSSYIVIALKNIGIQLFTSIFSVQFITDLLDKSIAILISLACLKHIPYEMKLKFKNNTKGSEKIE